MIVRPRESALGEIVEGDDLAQVGHAQLCTQCVHNRGVRKTSAKRSIQCTMQVAFAESAPVLGRQPLRHRGDHLFSMGTASFADYVLAKSCQQDMS
jgi:hypothetical protein